MICKARYIVRSLLALCCILPLAILVMLSISKNWVFPHLLPANFTIENWVGLLEGSNDTTKSFFVSLSIALSVAAIASLLGFIASKFIAYHKKSRQLLLLAYFPFALSPVIFAICLKFYFLSAGLSGNITGIILAQLFIAVPYSIIVFTGFWNPRIKQYQDLVHTLGGTQSQAFRKIILPLARPIFIVCFFQCFLISWFEYGLTTVIGYGKVQTLTVKVFQFIGEANIFQAALSCCILIIPPVVMLWVNKKFILQQPR